MSTDARKTFKERILSLVVTHDMYKRPKDPSSQRMKAEDWNIFIITTSVWAAEGLLDDDVLETWVSYRKAYINYLEKNFTQEARVEAREDLKNYGRGLETYLPITACTISNHLVIVEADYQIPVTGPISESTGAWVERLMNRLTEYVKRRYVTVVLLVFFFYPLSLSFRFCGNCILSSLSLIFLCLFFVQANCCCPGEGHGPWIFA